jgi:glycosyltransferase involved in cell wall biosynthesis
VTRVPTVSVVIPFFNAAPYLREAVESVVVQTFGDWELILVDDGSTDAGTGMALAYAAGDDRIRYQEHTDHRNLGQSASRNAAISAAAGEYIALLDADDAWLPTKLEGQLAIVRNDPGLGLVFGPAVYLHPDGERKLQGMTLPPGRLEPGSWVPAMLRNEDNAPCPSALLVRREAALAVGGFSEDLPSLYEDQGTWCKLALVTAAYHDPEPRSVYRIHASSTCGAASSRQRRLARLAFCSWLNRHLQENPADPRLRSIAEAHLLEAAVRVVATPDDHAADPPSTAPADGIPVFRTSLQRLVNVAAVAPTTARIVARGLILLAHARAGALRRTG